MATAAAPRAGAKPIDEAIRVIPSAWFRPNPRIYWTDMLASAAIGWTAFALAVVASSAAARAALFILAAFALYRAVLFIHELTHLAPHELPAFRWAWNLIVGIPLLLPSFLYEGVHTDHHRQRCYGTALDPEYLPFGRRPPMLTFWYGLGSLVLPLALAVRFAVLAPISVLSRRVRRFTVDHFSALVLNHRYLRHAPIDGTGYVQEVLATAFVWTVIALYAMNIVPAAALAGWYFVTTVASAINTIRTLAAHRYDHDVPADNAVMPNGSLTMTEQLLDSCTIRPNPGPIGRCAVVWRELWAPVGLRYHALHHWIPSLPYHNLGRAHQLLLSTLGTNSPYEATQYPAIAPLVVDLIRRARSQRS